MVYNIADFTVEFKNPSLQAQENFLKYISDDIPQVSFDITQKDIQFEIDYLKGNCTLLNAELTAILRKFYRWILDYNSFLLHSALISVDNTGVAFAAPSGTGKTTHMRLWQKLLGDKLTVINGDKPIVRFFDGVKYPVGYGTPWCGKERYGINSKVQIKHFCFIERSETNSCEEISPKDILNLFFKQILIPLNEPILVSKTLKLANEFLNNVTVWKIKCNMDISAAEVAYNTIFGGEKR